MLDYERPKEGSEFFGAEFTGGVSHLAWVWEPNLGTQFRAAHTLNLLAISLSV